MTVKTRATIEDLYSIPENGKAEIVDGEVKTFMPTGGKPGRAGAKIFFSLHTYELSHGGGYAFPDNVGFAVDLPERDSFSPDVAWYTGELNEMEFLEGSPVFAVEVRSKNDYGRQAEREIADKRRDYFAAGTQVVWDVDLRSENVIRSYRPAAPDQPVIFRRGDSADAEPAVPGWRIAVDELFA